MTSTTSQDHHEKMAAPFYRSLGRAMARWQHVEAGLFLVAHAILATDFRYSSTVFFMINSADRKLRLVTNLCKLYFDDGVFSSTWKPMAKEVEAAIKFRNGLAHFEANYITDPSRLEPGEPPIVLAAHHLDFSRRGSSDAASTNRMNHAADEFLLITNTLVDFVAKQFLPSRIQMEGLPEQIAALLTERQRRAGIYEPKGLIRIARCPSRVHPPQRASGTDPFNRRKVARRSRAAGVVFTTAGWALLE
jgi:hypothetical protein